MHNLELRRQIIHILYGPLLIFLYHYHVINNSILLGMIIGGSIASYMIKRQRLTLMARVLRLFERDHHMQQFPGRGVLFYTIGAYICLLVFEQSIAYAGILILSFGDALSNIIGRHFGRIKTRLNPNKYIEGTLVGIIVSIPIAYYFVPDIYAAVSAAMVSMFLEMPLIRIGDFEIDDNLLIPIGACFTLTLFVWLDKKELGKQGENIAADFLIKENYEILDRNFHKRSGEIDIIVKDKEVDEIAFVEVKTRRGTGFGYPEEAVSEKKIEKMTETAYIWLEEKGEEDIPWRLDIIAIDVSLNPPEITHIKNI